MIKRYLYTIGKYLSPAQREEVLREIEANLYDYLEENFGHKEFNDEEVEKAIRAMGHPKRVAEAYMTTPRSLIGSAYIDTYWLVVKIALIGTAIGVTIGNLIDLSDAKDSIQLFVRLITDIWQSSFASLGIVTAIFAVIQHYSPLEQPDTEEKWALSILENEPETHQKVQIFDLIVETFFICLGLVIINQATPILAIGMDDYAVIPLLDMTLFKPFILWITLILMGSLILNFYLLVIRKWQSITRLISIGLDVLGVMLVVKMALTPGIWNMKILADRIGDTVSNTATWFNLTVNITLTVFVIITAFDLYGHLKALLKRS